MKYFGLIFEELPFFWNRAAHWTLSCCREVELWGVSMDKVEARTQVPVYDYDYWRWWHNVLGVAITLLITVLISWW
jgi:hypothetical protein